MAKFPFIFLTLVIINIIMFILQLSIPNFTDMLVLNKSALNGEYWRFITAMFAHGGISHIVYNMFALVIFGFILEKVIKSRNFLIVYFISGIIANIISVNFYDSSLGASGAIMGIIGCLAVLRPKMGVFAFGIILPMFAAAILWILGDVIGVFYPTGTGNIAHLSGVAVGILAGVLLLRRFREQKSRAQNLRLPESYMRNWEDENIRN